MARPVLYFVRHGETDWNAAHRLQGQHDSALNASGRAQATRCGTILRDLLARDGRKPEELDYVASPLARAVSVSVPVTVRREGAAWRPEWWVGGEAGSRTVTGCSRSF